MKIRLTSVVLSGFVAAAAAQQRQGPFGQSGANPDTPPQNNTPAQNATPANPGVLTNPTGDAAGNATLPTTGVNSGVTGQPLTNATGGSAFNTPVNGTTGTNQAGATVGTAPLFLNI